jgi:hypothetical protein
MIELLLIAPVGVSSGRHHREGGCGEQGHPHALHRLSPLDDGHRPAATTLPMNARA